MAILTSDRRITWEGNVGISGGIPNKNTIYTTLSAGASTAAIQAALSACPANQVVKLAAGTYTLTTYVDWNGVNSGVVLRGAGPTTIINQAAGAYFYMKSIFAESALSVDANLSANATKDGTTLTLASVPSWVTVGDLICIDQLDDSSFVAGAGTEGGQSYREILGNGARGLGQMNRVTAKTATTITLETPLYYGFTTAKTAQIFQPGYNPSTNGPLTGCGIEDMTINGTTTSSFSNAIKMETCDSCWVKNVEINNMNGGAGIITYFCYRGEIRHNHIHDSHTQDAGQGYGVALYHVSCGFLIEDNIFRNLHNAQTINYGSSGNAFSYNYEASGTSVSNQNPGMNTHGVHCYMNLFEGNYCQDKVLADWTHGSSSHNTVFRCRVTGDNYTGNLDNYCTVSVEYYNRYWNIVGNVLGTAGQQNKYLQDSGSSSQGSQGSIIKVGGEVNAGNDFSPADANSYTSGSFILIHGNYDTVTASQHWDSNVADHVLPNSCLYSSAPAFFASLAWPPFDPTSPSSATATRIPAGYRYVNGKDPSGSKTIAANCSEATVWALINDPATVDGDTIKLPSNRPTGGFFTLTVKTTAAGSPQTTANIAHNADAATVKARLDALTNIQALAGGTGAVTVVETGRFEWKVTFPFQNQIPFTPPAPDLTEWSLPLMTVGTSSVTSASGAVDITINKWIAGFKGTVNKVHDVQRIAMGSAWSGFNVLSKQIILVGAASSVGVGGESIILNNLDGNLAPPKGQPWVLFNLVFNKTLEIDGVTWRNGTSPNAGDIDKHNCLQFQGQFKGSSLTEAYQLHIHHCRFEQMRQYPIFTDCVRGCVDHNVFYQCEAVAYTYNRGWQPTASAVDSQAYGDGSWAYPTNAGAVGGKFDAMYYEDNIYDQGLTGASGHPDGTFHDGTTGGRLVVRHTTMTQNGWTYGANGNPVNNNAALCTCHGTEGRKRSIRHLEYYNNYITAMATTLVTKQRGGTMVIFNNRVLAGGNRNQVFSFQQDNQGDHGYFGRSSGTNPVHKNDPGPYNTIGPPGPVGPANSSPPFFTGKVTSVALNQDGDSGVKVDFLTCTKMDNTSPGWTANQWKGYSITVTAPDRFFTGTGANGLTGGYYAEPQRMGGTISANSANVLQIEQNIFPGGTHAWANNDQIRIDRCLQSIDMAGTGSIQHNPPTVTSMVTGGAADIGTPNSAVLPGGWNNQTLEPCYEWNNVRLVSTGAPSEEMISWESNTFPQIRPGYNTKTGIMPGYPIQPTTQPGQVCGADIAPSSGKTTITQNGGVVYGAPYPHPLVSFVAPPAVPIVSIPSSYDFKNVVVNVDGTYDLEIFNIGGALLTVNSIAYSGAVPKVFTGYTTPSFTIASGSSVIKTITFTPTNLVSYSETVTISSNSAADPSANGAMTVTGKGVAAPAVPMIDLPASHHSGNVAVNQPDVFNIPVKNTGGFKLTVSFVTYNDSHWTGKTGSFEVAAGATVNLEVTFLPTAAVAYSSTIQVVSNATNTTDPDYDTVAVDGTGVISGSTPGKGKKHRKNVLISRF